MHRGYPAVGPVRRGAGQSRRRAGSARPWRPRSGGRALTSSHAAMSPGRIVRRDADHELPDRGCRRRPTGMAPAGVIPRAGDQPPVPGKQRRRGHREHRAPSPARDQSRRCCEPQPARLVADPADLAAQHRVLVPERQELGVLGYQVPGQHRQAAEQTTHEQVDERKDHSAMIPTRQPAQARSSNRAPHPARLPATRYAGTPAGPRG